MSRVTFAAGVLIHLLTSAAAAVKVDFYGEALCPYCARFLTHTLAPLYHSNFTSFFDFKYYPYGNAKVMDGETVCQHGPLECKVNTLLSCVMHEHPAVEDWLPYTICVEAHGADSILEAAVSCANKTMIDIEKAVKCTEGPLGAQLQSEAAAATAALQPPHTYVPWVLVDGVPLEDAFENLLKFVCVAYRTDPKPSQCYHVESTTALDGRKQDFGGVSGLWEDLLFTS